jgi:hypothetical protein
VVAGSVRFRTVQKPDNSHWHVVVSLGTVVWVFLKDEF